MSKISTTVIILLIFLTLIAAQCGSVTTAPPAENQDTSVDKDAAASGGPAVKVMEPFARASMPNGAVYMHLINEGDAEDRLISAEADVAETVELHETRIDENEVMHMSPVEMITIPAGGSATLEPGGLHVMLLGLKEALATGDTFELRLNFEQSAPQTIEVEVKEGMAMSHDPGDGDSDHAEDMDEAGGTN